MTDRNPVSDAEKAAAMVAQCEFQLRRAQEETRRATVMLRRAERAAELAEGELGDANRWRERVAVTRTTRVREARPGAPSAHYALPLAPEA